MEHKELLIKDLCPRLPYGLVIDFGGIRMTLHDIKVFQLYDGDVIKDYICLINVFGDDDYIDIENIKPYLFPMSSMTEKQREEYDNICTMSGFDMSELDADKLITFFYENHIDYRGLIKKGLAIDATNLSIY